MELRYTRRLFKLLICRVLFLSRLALVVGLPCVMPYVVAKTFAMPDVPVKELVQGVRYELREGECGPVALNVVVVG